MKKILYINLVLMVLFFSTPFSVCAQDNEPELKEQADKLFNKDNYIEATSLYLSLLALNPKSFEYNYKYGTCLLFNSYKKQDAFKYLNYAVTDPNITPEAYYFLGKAYHLNYQFNNAIKNYEIYKQKLSGNSNTKLAIDREIQMCQNGKNLLTTISDLVVIEKKEYSSKTFYQLYNLQNIGGNIIVTADYQSKTDKKKNHVPIIHYPNNPSRIYYSSYGENDNGSKDIYARTKLPNGTWSLPQSVGTNVNTNFDEDFPYMSADGKYLYFSSKGHNSMGGYDVYRSTYDLETNTFSPPENMDFAISSADDDLFYIVDSLEENAYFASSRQSSNGNFFVYKVRVDRVPTQLSIVKGSFSSTINPENKKVSIKVTDLANGTKIGDFKSNDKGTYLITFPKGGKYEYEMKVEGSNDIYKYTANIPFLKEFKPLKQKIYEEKGDAGTNVRVVDLFNEEVEDPQGVLVDVIRARSELNVNVNQFNLDELNAQKNDKKILANLGLENASNAEILVKFDGLEQKKEEQVHQVTQLHNGSIEQAVRNADEILILQKEVKTLVAKANSSDSDADKLRLLKIAEEKIFEIESLTNQNFQLKKLADSLAPIIPNENQELKRIADVYDAVQAALQKDDFASVKIAIEKEAELLISLQKSTTTDPSDELAAQIDRIKADKNKLTVQNGEYEKTLAQIKSDISQLEKDLLAAKSKDKALVQQKIDAKQAEKTLVEQEMLRINEKIAAKTKEEQTIVDQITFIESITSVSLDSDRNPKEITIAMEKVSDPNSRSVQNYVKEEVKNLERKVANNPDPKQLISSVNDAVLSEMNGFLEAQNAVDIDQNLSPEDKANASIANAQQTLVALKLQKEKLTLAKEKNPSNEQISSAISEIDSKEKELNGVIEEKKNDLAKIAGTSNTISNQTDAKTTEIVNNIFPEYETESSKLPEDAKAKIDAQNKLDEELITKIDKEIKATDKELKANPDKQEAKDKRAILEVIKAEKVAEIVERKAELAQLNNSSQENATVPLAENKQVLIESIQPNYASEIAKLPEDAKAKIAAQNKLDEELIAKIDKEIKATDKELKANPDKQEAKDKRATLEAIKAEKAAEIVERKAELAQLNNSNQENSTAPIAENKQALIESIQPNYASEIAKLPEDAKAKIEGQNKLDAELITKIDKEIKATDKELKANPDKQEAKDKRTTLEAIKAEKAAEIVERKAELAQLNNSNETNNTSSVINSTVLAHDIYPEYTDLNFEQQQSWTEQQRKDFILEELKLKDKLVKEKAANDKKLAKSENTELSAENKVIEELIARSEANIKRIESGENNQEVDNAIAEDLKDRNEILMNSSPQTEAEATQILSDLENYERNLLNSIGNLKEDDEANKATILLREKQLETVRKRIGVVEIDLQEMRELNSSSPAEKLAIEEVQNLKNKEKELTARLAEAEKPDQKKIQDELNKNRTLQKEKQTEIETNKVVQITASNKEELKNLSISTPSDLTEVATQAEARTEKENKNSLTEVTQVKNLIQAIDQYSVGKDPYENQQTIIYTEDALIQQQRSFSIEIGEIEAEIQSLGNSKKELQKKKDLEVRKTSLEKAQESVLEQMNIIRKDKNLVVNRSVEQNTQVSFEEEQAIAANEKYKDAYELFEEIKAIETKISDKNREINQVKLLIENSTSEQVKNQQIQQLIALNKERKGFENDLKASNQKLNDLILQESSNPMKWRNVLMREVLPATLIVVSTFVDPSVVKGFEITTDKSKQVNSAAIPKDLKSPGGLVYRVQVGAFAKPLRKELFKEFSLVTGEVLPNGITRYMAGFFGSRNKVAEAQKQIQSLGYKTAFIVAYCDGKRISIAEAKRLEDAKLCVPQSQDEIAFDVARSVIAKLPKDSIRKIAPNRKFEDYNKAPGAVQAETVENRKGLFYTVQIGVYNSPATSEKVRNIKPLITKRLENGQIRYSSGVFNSVEEANPKKEEAIARGIKDAFITAYYDGERISLTEAEQILKEKGQNIIEKENLTKTAPIEVQEAKTYSESNPVQETVRKTYQLISKQKFEEYPRDLINRYNTSGQFFYDEKDQKIKSVVYTNEYRVPNSEMFSNTMDTLIGSVGTARFEPNTKKIVAEWDAFELAGELGNKLLRFSSLYSVDITDLGCIITFESVLESKVDALLEELKKMNAKTVEVKEL